MGRFSGEGLCCLRGGRVVFEDVSFDLSPGGALVLTGPNGSGKSSLLRLMAGLGRPWRGGLFWEGGKITDDPIAHGNRLHYIGHHDALKNALSVRENLSFWARMRGSGDVKIVAAAIESVGLQAVSELPAGYLSAGQRRRLALARLFAAPALLWLLDEPRTALDAGAVEKLDGLIAGYRAGGGMIVLALHGGQHPPEAKILDLRNACPSVEASLA